MPKHAKKMNAMARGAARGMARGGVQAASVGGDIGRWIGDWLQGWLGFANGGEVSKADLQEMVAELPANEQKLLLKEATADLKKAVKEGEVELPADAPAMSVGGDIGAWIGDWLQSWLGFAKGGAVRRVHSVFQ
jgi:phage tail tape-measure protein